jgi:ABC-type transport system involved in Fe-S cluster assembly fused permease/ATPase subunit
MSGQDTSKRIKLRVFTHLHSLSLNFHLQRKTGEVLKVRITSHPLEPAATHSENPTQVVERGASSLQSLLSMALFTIAPTIIDLILVPRAHARLVRCGGDADARRPRGGRCAWCC